MKAVLGLSVQPPHDQGMGLVGKLAAGPLVGVYRQANLVVVLVLLHRTILSASKSLATSQAVERVR